MRLIDVDAWWEEAQKLYTDGDCADADRYKVGINVGITASRGVMYHLPSIDIVRCKDCKWKYLDNSVWACPYGMMIPNENGFCSYGERRTE